MIDPIAFAVAVVLLLAVPGPTNTLLAGSGATVGVVRSLPLLIGELAGYSISIATLRQLETLLGDASGARLFLKLAITGYLVYLAIRLWRGIPNSAGVAFTVRRVFITTLLNPKALIFALLIFPQPPTAIIPYFAAFCLMVVTIGSSWVMLGSLITRTSERFRTVAPKVCAVALGVFAIVVVSGTLNR